MATSVLHPLYGRSEVVFPGAWGDIRDRYLTRVEEV